MSHLDEGRLNELLDGELDEVEQQAAEAHIATCAECRRLYAEAQAILAEADDLIETVQVPPAAWPEADVGATPDGAGRRGRLSRWRTLAWAASLLLAVGLGWFGRESRLPPNDTGGFNKTATGPAAPPPSLEEKPSVAPAQRAQLDERDQKATAQLHQGASAAGKMAAPAERATPQPEIGRRQAKTASPPGSPPARTEPDLAAQDAGRERRALEDAPAPPQAESNAVGIEGVGHLLPRDQASRPVPAPALTRKANQGTEFRSVDMEVAVRVLAGSIRLVDGLSPTHVLVGPGSVLPGADPGLEVVRVVYLDPPARELWLDQQRPASRDDKLARGRESGRITTLLLGDTLVSASASGSRSLRWIDQAGFRLALTGFLPADSLAALARRVQ
jgi:hypothetical protein